MVVFGHFPLASLSALAANSDILARCTPLSILEAVREAASLGVEPAGYAGEAAIVRYGDQARLSVMWRGYLKRIRNSGEVAAVDCQLVYLNDPVFELEFGTMPRIRHVPLLFGEKNEAGNLLADRGAIRGVYAWAKLRNGELLIEWMPDVEVALARQQSPSVQRNRPSPWDNWYGEMARKTVIRRLAKRLPQEAVQRLVAYDDSVTATEEASLPPNDPRTTTAAIAMRAVGMPVAEPAPELVEPTPVVPVVEPTPVVEPEVVWFGSGPPEGEPPLPEPPSDSPATLQRIAAPPTVGERTPAPLPERIVACDAPAGEQRENERCLLPEGHSGVHRGPSWSWPR